MVGIICVGISLVSGVTLGMMSGFFPRIDNLIMRFMDIMLAFPTILLAIAIMALFDKPSLYKAMIAIGIVYIPQYARIARGSVLQIKEREFIEAARAIGLPDFRIIFSHLLPNIMSPIIVYATLGIGSAILECAALGFLGLGAQPPTPEWGKMLSDGREYIYSGSWWVTTFPGIAILIVVLGFNLFGDGLRDALDPRLKE
jgi:ABC-type dipeptide/oligopeptide/nickel transport system permease subunit